ncbi:MAG: hypothetical protein KDK41_18205, partial [Leptospiraceae bacterium]|nr:hypothetical protein [Leptospiraceae bacterium]
MKLKNLILAALITFAMAGEIMSVSIQDENRIPQISAEIKKLESMSVVVGPMGDEGSDMQIIASVQEFG